MKFNRLLLIAVLMIFSLAACTQKSAENTSIYPTPPSLPQEKTPLELLTAAIDKTKAAVSCTIQYGTVTKTGDEAAEDIHSQNVTLEQAFSMDALYQALPDFPTNANLLTDFCSMPLRAIPSNDGTFRYELSALTPEQLSVLMYGEGAEFPEYGEYSQVICTAAIEVNANGCFSRLEFTTESYDSADQPSCTVTLFLSIRSIDI